MKKSNPLLQFGNVPTTAAVLESCFSNLEAPQKKIQALEKDGDLIRLKRGLYVVSEETSGKSLCMPLCANHLYGPSYVSLRWALRWYGLIPERVFRMTSITTKHARKFETSLGVFDYHKVSMPYFQIGIMMRQEEGASFLIASPEKALCDMIMFDSHVPNQSVMRLEQYLEEDIRFDMDELSHFDESIVKECANVGNKKRILNNLIKIIKQ